jgi:hypothetical protein
MNIRRIVALLVLLVVVVFCVLPARSAPYHVKKFILWNGTTFDSTAKTKWLNVLHANHIVIRSWSTHAAYVANTDAEADSTFSDSIGTWVTLFSDSLSFMARDSAGTVVTASNLIPTTSAHGDPYPICADSVSMTGASLDTTAAWVGVSHPALNLALRAPANGSGILTRVYSIAPAGVSVYGDGEIGKKYMGIKITPVRRATAATVSATVPARVNGLKGFRMEATIYYQDER